jgi:hypothetical protein
MTSCGTVDSSGARLGGVRPDDAAEIALLVHVQTTETIVSYIRRPDGAVDVRTRAKSQAFPHVFTALSVNGKWHLTNDRVIEF